MVSESRPTLELDDLRGRWLSRLEENLAQSNFSAEELTDLASRYRALAETTESRGQRRAALTAADRFEQAASERVAAKP